MLTCNNAAFFTFYSYSTECSNTTCLSMGIGNLKKDCLPSQTAHNSSVFHCTGRHPSPRRFRHTGPDFIKKPASQGETKQVLKCAASCSDPLWNSMSFNSKDAIFYSEFQERFFFFFHFCVRSVTPCPNYTDWSLLFLEHWTSQMLSPSLLCGLSVVELDAYFFIPNPIYITS